MMKTTLRAGSWLWVVGVGILACGGGSSDSGNAADDPPRANAPTPTPVPSVEAPSGPVDQALAGRGEQVWMSKGCVGCHTVGGGRLTGPDLAGVTERREFPWFVAMVINPDSMLRNDPTARALFQEYMTPMLSMGVTADEARAVFEYLRREGG